MSAQINENKCHLIEYSEGVASAPIPLKKGDQYFDSHLSLLNKAGVKMGETVTKNDTDVSNSSIYNDICVRPDALKFVYPKDSSNKT